MSDKPDPTLGPVDGFGDIPDTEAVPIVQITKAVGIGCHEAGDSVRLTVETLTQGEVAIQIDLPVVTELIKMLTEARHLAEKLYAATHGGARPVTLTNVLSFSIGNIPEAPAGVMLVINHDAPSEQMFLVPNPKAARDIARSLAQGAEDATRRSRGILPGMNGHGKLLGPSGRPLS